MLDDKDRVSIAHVRRSFAAVNYFRLMMIMNEPKWVMGFDTRLQLNITLCDNIKIKYKEEKETALKRE